MVQGAESAVIGAYFGDRDTNSDPFRHGRTCYDHPRILFFVWMKQRKNNRKTWIPRMRGA
jgi:hypothetical protein